MTPQFKITAGQFHKDMTELVEKLSTLPFKPEETLVVAVARGGLAPAQYVAYGLGIRNVSAVQTKMYWDKTVKKEKLEISNTFHLDYENYKQFIIVDDIYDSGATMNGLLTVLRETAQLFDCHIQFIPAVVYTQHSKKKMEELGITFARKIKAINGEKPWVVFPSDRVGIKGVK